MAQSAAMVIQPIALPVDFDLLEMHEAQPERYPFLLESVASATSERQNDHPFDILFGFPGETLRLDERFNLHGPVGDGEGHAFLPALDKWWRRLKRPSDPDLAVPFHGGWFLFLGYELVREIEPGIRTARPPAGPVAFATRIPVAVIRNRNTGQGWIVAEEEEGKQVALVERDLRSCRGVAPGAVSAKRAVTSIVEPESSAFLLAVDRIRSLIAGGDVYQVNLARQWLATVQPGCTPAEIYRRLRRTNPAPFAGIATQGDWAVISSSPERLVRSRGGVVDTRPIAGTRPTADDPGLEEARRQDLLGNPKERAEHIMLIDLERNDLGRVSQAGSVEVDEFMVVESFAHVHHIVSNVRGRLRDGVSPGELIRAMFPGGTITGCPKVRCMEIISELETVPRGPYTGSMGYLNRDGSCDLNILIRSFAMRGSELSFSAGSGIVADSQPVRELEETRAKAKGLLLALTG